MPLNRFNVTDYSRDMIPAFPLFAAAVGIGWIVTPTEIMEDSPVFEFLARFAPLWVWGGVYVIGAAFLFIAVFRESRTMYINGLRAFIVISLSYALSNAFAFFTAGATPSAWLWPAFTAFTALVTLRSLRAHEADPIT